MKWISGINFGAKHKTRTHSAILLKLKLLLRPQGQIIDVKCEKSQKISHFEFFSAIIELVRELLISNMHNKNKVKLLMKNVQNRNK